MKEGEWVEMTWMTGNGTAEGTAGAKTVLRIELVPRGEGTLLRLTHSGFASEMSRVAHAENWPLAFEALDAALASGRAGPRVEARHPLDEIAAAHVAVEERRVGGRVVGESSCVLGT